MLGNRRIFVLEVRSAKGSEVDAFLQCFLEKLLPH